MALSGQCSRCGEEDEDVLHCLLDCSFCFAVWREIGFGFTLGINNPDVMSWIKQMICHNNRSLFLARIWWVWHWRLNFIFYDTKWSIHQVIHNIFQSLHEFSLLDCTINQPEVCWQKTYWQPPLIGYVTLNVDWSVSLSKGVSGCRGVIRNDEGRWLLGFNCKSHSMMGLSVELHALLVGWIYGYIVVIIETNCLNISIVFNNDAILPKFKESIAELREFLSRRWHVKLEHINRSANMVANSLAKHGANGQCDMRVFTSPPQELLHLLNLDLVGVV